MAGHYKEFKELNFAKIADEILEFWKEEKIFEKSVTNREGAPSFTFYEGPPSANGTPGIHHVMARTVKDIFCRYKTLQGYQVKRKGGWDTHGLPVELQVEKQLGITKDDIGKKISIEDYNKKCRETVMLYKDQWDDLTMKMGYWVDLDNPYITYEKEYIESLWWILKEFYKKGLLYKGYTIQPYSPAAGTGLSSHELNLPGCYKDVKDTSIVAQFKVKKNQQSNFLFDSLNNASQSGLDVSFEQRTSEVFILAWTTTPWTLPSNTALAVGPAIKYCLVKCRNPYTGKLGAVILAQDTFSKFFIAPNNLFDQEGNPTIFISQSIPDKRRVDYWEILMANITGKQLVGIAYEQLMPYVQPLYDADKAFQVVAGDFVTTEDGTGVVHTSPTFGADDFRVAKQNGIPPLTVKDEADNEVPTVDKKGKFISIIGEKLKEGVARFGIKTHKALQADDFYVKNYTNEDESHPDYKNTDVIISIILKEENKAFKVEKYEHTYPHCWRTDKPVLYYPLDSWFIKTTALKDRMVQLNKTINWKPESTGTGRFGNWLENLVDWNLSRSRYWGTPLPIWRTKDNKEEICIGSLAELNAEVAKSVNAGFMKTTLPNDFDLHRPYVDDVVLVSASGQPMYREADLIDVWFDSGAMPYAQWHYPFENNDVFATNYPADFIAEGVDQTRGWFFTLHAIAVMLNESSNEIAAVNKKVNNGGVAFKNVISNGLVLDKSGNKMSKSKGNVVNPFETLAKYGPDVVRWYMIENAPPWDNLKFDFDGITEVQRRFFGTLQNTYSFFALYANIDGFQKDEMHNVPYEKLTHLDRWIISKLQTLETEVRKAYEEYEPTRAARALQDFVNDHLSNWYVRLNRKRFWKGEMSEDKKAAYETLYECLMIVGQLMAPIAPFFSDWMYGNLTENIREAAIKNNTPLRHASVHLTDLAQPESNRVDAELEKSMEYAQRICSLVHSIRKNSRIKVRTPLQKILLPVLDEKFASRIKGVEEIILAEVNVKSIEYIDDASGVLVKKVKPNFAKLGKQYGPKMKEVSAIINAFTAEDIAAIEKNGALAKGGFNLVAEDVLISSEDIPGWSVAVEGGVTVALDITLTEDLKKEGVARDFVNRVQNLRKEMGLEVLDKIGIEVEKDGELIAAALTEFREYISTETQALTLEFKDHVSNPTEVDMDEFIVKVKIFVKNA
ncbi:MAG: isoleucine--tRNA ligase [Cyclobacteriaceae bacterium]|nr:isoleucine--tRNA ligase [Cyclobacteriaceae bacterium]